MSTIDHEVAYSDEAASTSNDSQPEDRRTGLEPLPWRPIVRWAAVGALVMLALVMLDVRRNGGENPVSLLQPGTRGSATALFTHDFPHVTQPVGDGLDGQIYYAIARDPFHPTRIARFRDRPRYRLQHPLLSWVARVLHPATGGGLGLTWALFVVGLIGLLGGGLATGALSSTFRGPPWIAALFPLLPGSYWALRVTVSDALALALGAITLAARTC